MGRLRRAIEWERRAGPPVNRFMVRLYEWLFVVIGPVALIFGGYGLVLGHWIGLILVVTGLWWTWLGWKRLLRRLDDLRRNR